MNYLQWFQSAVRFHEELDILREIEVRMDVSGPLLPGQFAELTQWCKLPVPENVRQFYTSACSDCDLFFVWSPPIGIYKEISGVFPQWHKTTINGGLRLCWPGYFNGWNQYLISYMEYRGLDQMTSGRLFKYTLPLFSLGTGNHIGLYVEEMRENPPVAYLCLKDVMTSRIIAPTFDEFLNHWGRLCYIGFDLLQFFIDSQSGMINPSAFPLQTNTVRKAFRRSDRA